MTFRTAVTFVGLVAAAAAHANLISNGSFENVTGSTIDNWILTPSATSEDVSVYTAQGATGSSIYGPRFLAFNGGDELPTGSATQDFGPTALGTTYQVSFAYGQFRGSAGDQTLVATINGTSVPIITRTFTNIAPSQDFGTIWNRASFTFVGTGLPTGITFSDVGTLNTVATDLFVDDVSIEAVPEPATMAALGLGALGLLRRRRA